VSPDPRSFIADFKQLWDVQSGLSGIPAPKFCSKLYTTEPELMEDFKARRKEISAAIILSGPLLYTIKVNEDLVDMPQQSGGAWGSPEYCRASSSKGRTVPTLGSRIFGAASDQSEADKCPPDQLLASGIVTLQVIIDHASSQQSEHTKQCL
jgi:hypothetical protein